MRSSSAAAALWLLACVLLVHSPAEAQVASVVTAGGNFVPSNVGTGNAPAGFGLVVPPSPKKPMVTGDVPLEPTGSDSTDTLLLQDMVTVTRKLLSMSTRARTAATKSANKSKAAQHKAPTKKPAAHPVSDKYAEARSVCLKQINHDRHTLNLKPLVAWEAAWPCTDAQAAADGAANRAHSAFTKCQEWAQNECPGWPFVAEVTIVQCLAQMWAEGPGKNFEKHGHYINMSNKNYTRVSCGFAMVNGKLWATQDFTWA